MPSGPAMLGLRVLDIADLELPGTKEVKINLVPQPVSINFPDAFPLVR